MYKSVIDYLYKMATQSPDKIAIRDWVETLTYYQLNEFSKKVATIILEKTCKVNSPIIVLMNGTAKAITAFMGIAYTRNMYVPLDVCMPINRLIRILKSLSSNIIITDTENYDYVSSLVLNDTEIIVLDERIGQVLIKDEVYMRYQQTIDTDILYIIYTSGSTGVPKGVVISHRAVIDFTEEAVETIHLNSADHFLNQAPFHFDASVPDIYCSIFSGATLHLIPKQNYFNPLKVVRYIETERISTIFWVPSVLILIANARVLRNVDISCLKNVMFCGEVLPVKQFNIWKQSLPEAMFINYYGPSEITYACSYYIINRDFKNDEKLPIGQASRNTEIVLLDENDYLCQQGKIGEICVKGSCLSTGYYNDRKNTEKVFVQNPLIDTYKDIIYRTGDLAKYNDYGELEYICRKDNQIKHNGYRIELSEVEYALSVIEGVHSACCLYNAEKHILIAFYVSDSLLDLDKKLNEYLPEYMLPSKYIKLEHMFYNTNGKIDRLYLKEHYF